MADPKLPDAHLPKEVSGSGAESPTTARPLDFDDEPLNSGPTSPHPAGEEHTQAKQPRSLSPQQQAEATLREAFPSIDAAVVKAVLMASGGRVEPAFNALLGMTDPDSQTEPAPPPKPPRPTRLPVDSGLATSTPRNQLEADEMYARQLAEHYHGPRQAIREREEPTLPRRKTDTGLKPNELYDDREHSFLDDDLPVIKENIRKGFLETQSKVNQWVTQLKKKLDGEDDEDAGVDRPSARPKQGYNPNPQERPYGQRRSGDSMRRSTDRDRERYDADPRVLSDDFVGLDIGHDEAPRRSTRPLANPDLFKPTPVAPRTSSNPRKVSFQDEPESDSLYRAPAAAPVTSKQSKWEPLSTLDPSPVADDPFSLGDSDEERESKGKDTKGDGPDRVKEATAAAMAEDIGGDKKVEDKLTGK
ncbi:MAG: ubiquitin-binding protein cue5 [Geoglossum umbratile]|nr:MAG: ubiquitin-binding protein cue5 [Geoglossum umbratile]